MERKLDQQGAETVAVQVLGWLARDDAQLERFLSVTGIEPSEIRIAAGQPGFLLAVLEHVCDDQSFLLALAANSGIAPESIEAARQRLASPVALLDE